VKLVFVHLSNDDAKAQKYFALSRLDDVPRIADPEGRLYQAFGLVRANWRQYFNAESITRMVVAWMDGHWVGAPAGDVERMPGVFLMVSGEIRKAFRHKLVSDRPDYLALASLA
jgi:hypothetical protein